MKIIISIILFLIAGINISAQNVIDPDRVFHKDTYNYITPNYQGFILGWNWGAPGKNLDSALMINTYHGANLNSNDYFDNMLLIQPIEHPVY